MLNPGMQAKPLADLPDLTFDYDQYVQAFEATRECPETFSWSVLVKPRGDRETIALFGPLRRILVDRFEVAFESKLPVGWAIARWGDDVELRVGCISAAYSARQANRLRPGRGYAIDHPRALTGGMEDSDEIEQIRFEISGAGPQMLVEICAFCRELGVMPYHPMTCREIDVFCPECSNLYERFTLKRPRHEQQCSQEG
jgi:hypothetical protein